MYRSPSVSSYSILSQLETVTGWVLEYSRLIVLRDFNIHFDAVNPLQASDLVSSMAALGLSQIESVPMHQAGHALDLIFGFGGVDVPDYHERSVMVRSHDPEVASGCSLLHPS